MKRIISTLLILLSILTLTGCKSEGTQSEEPRAKRIALIDTGISTRAIDPYYIESGKNYVAEDSSDTEDTYGHGTAVASIILREADNEEVTLVPLVVSAYEKGKLKSVDTEMLAEAITDAVVTYHCDVIHISAGMEQDSDTLHEAVSNAKAQGVLIVAAAGNDYQNYPDKTYYPAAYEEVTSVGALDKNGDIAKFSQRNADVYEIGEDVPYLLMSGKKKEGNGTSFAAAVYTGTVISRKMK